MGRIMLSKSLIQFSVDGWSCVPSLLFPWVHTKVEVMKIMVTSLKWSHACTATLNAPNPGAGNHRPTPRWRLLDTHRPVWVSLLYDHCSFLLGPGAQVLFVPSKSLFPVLCKFWWLSVGVKGDVLQEGLCHTQVCCTQSPCPCGSPLLTRTSTGDTQTQFCLSLYGVPGSWCTQGLLEPSDHLWREWGLILNVN